jgi:hypothetical protein
VPNLNEFISKPEKVMSLELEKMGGKKPCGKCDKDSEEYFWNATERTISWECPDGHSNSYVVG